MSEDLVKKQLQEEATRCDDLTNEYKRLDSELQSALQHGEGRLMNLTRQKDAVEQRRRVSHDCVIRLQNELLLDRQTGKDEVSPQEPNREEQTERKRETKPKTQALELWEQIPAQFGMGKMRRKRQDWHAEALRLRWEGAELKVIAKQVLKGWTTIRAFLTALRQTSPPLVPTPEQLRGIKKKKSTSVT